MKDSVGDEPTTEIEEHYAKVAYEALRARRKKHHMMGWNVAPAVVKNEYRAIAKAFVADAGEMVGWERVK